ncbi:MAG: MipA/OmpV family protein [Granulosicoccus sp.]|nr:MipA/OmpV family protein [Granulosicoccus sp.]
MNLHPPLTRLPFFCVSLILAAFSLVVLFDPTRQALAADISREVRQGQAQTDGFLELGLNLGFFRVPVVGLTDNDDDPTDPELSLGLIFNGMVEWRGFFAEALFDSFGGVTLGYRAIRDENRSFELVLTNTLHIAEPDTAGFENIETRDPDAVFGLRSSWYLPNSIAQFSLLTDVSDTHNGFTASAHWGKTWQIRNWNLHAMTGLRHFSEKVSDYYLGVPIDQVSTEAPAYQARAGTLVEFDLGATVPLNENWIFRTGLQVYRLPGSFVDSPLTSARVAYEISNGVYYVF